MRKFKVQSNSQKSINYDIMITDDGERSCNCPSGSRNRLCNHVLLVMNFINRKLTNPIDYDRIEEIK